MVDELLVVIIVAADVALELGDVVFTGFASSQSGEVAKDLNYSLFLRQESLEFSC